MSDQPMSAEDIRVRWPCVVCQSGAKVYVSAQSPPFLVEVVEGGVNGVVTERSVVWTPDRVDKHRDRYILEQGGPVGPMVDVVVSLPPRVVALLEKRAAKYGDSVSGWIECHLASITTGRENEAAYYDTQQVKS